MNCAKVNGIFNFLPSTDSDIVIIDQSHERFILVFFSPNEGLRIPLGNKSESSGCTRLTGRTGKGFTTKGDVGKYSGKTTL